MLQAMYPTKFVSIYKNETDLKVAESLWDRQLHGIDYKFISQALYACPTKFTWVPDVGEFKSLCLSFVPAVSKYVEYKSNPRKNTHNIQLEVEVMSRVAKKIKTIFFKNENWSMKLACEISPLLNEIKIFAKKYFFDHTHDEFFREIDKFSDDDIKICLEFLDKKNET